MSLKMRVVEIKKKIKNDKSYSLNFINRLSLIVKGQLKMLKIPHSSVNFDDWTTKQMIVRAARNRAKKHTQNNNIIFRPGPRLLTRCKNLRSIKVT